MSFSEALFFGVTVISVGLLLLDLVPLQETMVCESYSNKTTCPEVYFSQTYFDARAKFVAAATAIGCELQRHVVVADKGVDYTIDTAFIQGRSDVLLVHVSGTHGVEGYVGSAIQTKILQDWNESRANGPSVLLVHALNPFGMANYRRFNEENVDLNRNVLSEKQWKEVLQRDPNYSGYETFRELLSPSTPPRLIDRYVHLFRSMRHLVQHGYVALKRALVTGQYHHPEGLYFGGFKEQPSISIFRRIIKPYEDVKRVVLLDVHSGLGKEGVDTMMVGSDTEAAVARRVFSATVQSDESATSGPSSGYNLGAGYLRGPGLFHGDALYVTEEFGTVNPLFVARALILENAAYHHARGSYVHSVMGTWLRDVFYPQTVSFKLSVLKHGVTTFDEAWKYLLESQS